MNEQKRAQCLMAFVVSAIVFGLLVVLTFSCTGPVDSALAQSTPTAEHYEYLPHIHKAIRPTVTPMPTARPTAVPNW